MITERRQALTRKISRKKFGLEITGASSGFGGLTAPAFARAAEVFRPLCGLHKLDPIITAHCGDLGGIDFSTLAR